MRKFHRKTGKRRAFLKGLAHALIMKGTITTTEIRAKAIRPIVERLVTTGKAQDTASFRTLLSKLPRQSAEKLFYDIAPRFKDRRGGYLRIIKQGKARMRDAAKTAIILFVN